MWRRGFRRRASSSNEDFEVSTFCRILGGEPFLPRGLRKFKHFRGQSDPADFPIGDSLINRMPFLVRYAILAPSSHNTEPWQFRVRENRIDVLIDRSRRLKVADNDQRELHISVGCALENLLVAAEHFGLGHTSVILPSADDSSLAATVTFFEQAQAAPHRPAVLFDMIPVRHTNHQRYEDRAVPSDVLHELRGVCVEEGIRLHLTDDLETKRKADELVIRGDAIEFADPAFREELAYWIGQGVFGTGWLMSKIGKLAVSYFDMGKSQGRKDSDILMSSPILGLFSSEQDDRQSQLRVGQAYQRLSLLAASHGIWCQPMSQIVQVPELKAEVATWLPESGLMPQHPFRMGYAAAEQHHTPRRRVEKVLV